MLITQLAGGGNSPEMRTLFMAAFTSTFPLAGHYQFYEMTGNADSIEADQTETGGTTRAINGVYSDTVTSTGSVPAALVIYGDSLKTDTAYDRRGEKVQTKHRQSWESFAKGMGRDFMWRIVNDGPTHTATRFLGWKYLVDPSMKIQFMGANGGQLLSDGTANAKKSINALVETIDYGIELAGDPSSITIDGLVIARMESNLRDIIRVEKVTDALGNDQRLRYYREIPLISAGFDKSKANRVLAYNETLGTSTDCTSVWISKYGEKEDLTGATNVGFLVNSTLVENVALKTTAEMDFDQVLQRKQGLVKIEGIRVPAS